MSPLRMYFVVRGATLSRAFRLEAISALRASMVVQCAKIDYLSRAAGIPSLFAPFYPQLSLSQHHQNVRHRRRSEVRECHNLRSV